MGKYKVELKKIDYDDGETKIMSYQAVARDGPQWIFNCGGKTPKEALGKLREGLEQRAEDCWDAIEDIEFKRYTDLTEVKVADQKSTT